MNRSMKTRVAGLLMIAVAFVGGQVALAETADAKAVPISAPDIETPTINPVIWVEHVQGRWHYAELYDGSEWMVTRCRYEDSRNCYWNAKVRGNGEGRSFVDLRGKKHWVNYAAQP